MGVNLFSFLGFFSVVAVADLDRLAGDVLHRHALPQIGLAVRRGEVGGDLQISRPQKPASGMKRRRIMQACIPGNGRGAYFRRYPV
jgi:hypothetical protein